MKMMLHKVMMRMKNHRIAVGAGGLIILTVAWYLFRPELLFIDAPVDEGFPVSTAGANTPAGNERGVLSQGKFHSVAHAGKGTATVHQLADGKRVLRLTEFETSNGPALHVYLVAANDAADNDTVKQVGSVDLGALKGNVGDQNYEVPADVDLAKYRAVTIWCQRFSVNFATAPLMAEDSR